VLFLDEPTAGLDPQSRRELHALVRQMRHEGRTVVLTTHYIEEAEQLCDRIAIIDHGQIIATGTPRQLVNGSRASPRISFTSARPPELARLSALSAVQSVELHQSGAMLSSTDVGRTMVDLVVLLQSQSNDLTDVHVHTPSLEDVFIELTGHSIRD
jgi:ABC-2 type transport system ATP-binding protein